MDEFKNISTSCLNIGMIQITKKHVFIPPLELIDNLTKQLGLDRELVIQALEGLAQ